MAGAGAGTGTGTESRVHRAESRESGAERKFLQGDHCGVVILVSWGAKMGMGGEEWLQLARATSIASLARAITIKGHGQGLKV